MPEIEVNDVGVPKLNGLLNKCFTEDICGRMLVATFGVFAILSTFFTGLAAQFGQDLSVVGLGLSTTGFFVALWTFYSSEQSRKQSDTSIDERLAEILREIEKCRCKCPADGTSE